MNIKLVIFDLDGTLLNTIDDLALSVNHVLKKRGYPTHSIEQYKYFVGNGVTKLIERAIPKELSTPELVRSIQDEYVEYYAQHGKENTTPYQGIEELITKLTDSGIDIAVASNKHHSATIEIIEYYFGKNTFCIIFGKREGYHPKPDPQIIYDILKECGVTKDEVLYVGDSNTDMTTATNASVQSIGVTWGFRTREELQQSNATHIIDSPIELLNIIS